MEQYSIHKCRVTLEWLINEVKELRTKCAKLIRENCKLKKQLAMEKQYNSTFED